MSKKQKPDTNPLHDRKLMIVIGSALALVILIYILTGL
jgi:hypothetical protein